MTSKSLAKNSDIPDDAWELLSPRLTDRRRERLEHVAAHRTNHVRLLLESVDDPHNISACLRSAEAFGVQNIDVVARGHSRYRASGVARGSGTWLDIHSWNDPQACFQNLKNAGVRIAAGYPSAPYSLYDLPLDQPIAILFGNEHAGVSDFWWQNVDYRFTIPMVGMVESLNVSVSAALSMNELTRRACSLLGPTAYHLDPAQQKRLLNRWVCRQSRDYINELKVLRARQTP